VLAATAVFLARECKGLLIGEPARSHTLQSICEVAQQQPEVKGIGRLITVHLAPQQIVAVLDVDFVDCLLARDVEDFTDRLERLVKQKHPDVIALFVNPKKNLKKRNLKKAS
jgi:divalent metal cation (Fe/Co/Zn/Cd) transporter